MKWFDNNKEKVATEITNSMGKPKNNALNEIKTMMDRTNNLCNLSNTVLQDDIIQVDSNKILKIKKEPVGFSFMISPWNYPLITVINVLVTSILCGNPVLLKHSVRTPKVGDFFQEAFDSTGIKNVVQHLFLEAPDIKNVYACEKVNFVSFTGSVTTGKEVLKDIASKGRFINSVYELGGKDPAYVRNDANLKKSVANLIDGAMYNAGQSCCSIERCYVHESIYDKFIEEAVAELKNYTLGNPLGIKDGDNIKYPSYGPMALPDSLYFIKDQVDKAGLAGAEIIYGGNMVSDSDSKGRFFEPTLLINCDHNMDIMREETFGPVLPVCKVSSDEEALSLMNESQFGLTAAVYTEDYAFAEKFMSKVDAGTVFLNGCDSLNPLLPWSGRKNSGVGIGLSKYGFNALYKTKGYNFNLSK